MTHAGRASRGVAFAMINPEYPLASWYLAISTSFFVVVVALPLLFAQGVAFDIYYVAAWARGERALLPSTLTRAVLYSALTNGTAFATLAFSAHPGTAGMGTLLTVSLLWALLAVLLVLPPLLHAFAPDVGATPGSPPLAALPPVR